MTRPPAGDRHVIRMGYNGQSFVRVWQLELPGKKTAPTTILTACIPRKVTTSCREVTPSHAKSRQVTRSRHRLMGLLPPSPPRLSGRPLAPAFVRSPPRPRNNPHFPGRGGPLSPVICTAEDALYATTGNLIHRIEPRRGQVEWSTDLTCPFHGAVVSLLVVGPFLIAGACG